MENDIDRVRQYIQTEFDYPEEIASDIDLLHSEILDSFSIVQLAVWMEEEFGLDFDAEDLVRENLSSLDNIANLISTKRAA